MANSVDAFFEAVKTRLVAIQRDGKPAFAVVTRMPEVDLDRVAHLTNWPMAILIDRGGERHRSATKIDRRRFEIAVVHRWPSDVFGDGLVREIHQIGALVLDEFADDADDDDDAIFISEDTELDSISVNAKGAFQIAVKSYVFRCDLLIT